MAYEPPLLCHMNRFYWGWWWSLISPQLLLPILVVLNLGGVSALQCCTGAWRSPEDFSKVRVASMGVFEKAPGLLRRWSPEKPDHPEASPRTRVKWVPFVLLAFFRFKLAIFPLKRSVLGAWKGHIRTRKGQMVNSGFHDPKTTWNACQTREKNVITPRLASRPQIGPKSAIKLGKKRQKAYFARPPPPPRQKDSVLSEAANVCF